MNQIFLKSNPKIVQKNFEKTQTRIRWSLGVEGGVLGFVLKPQKAPVEIKTFLYC